MAGAEIFSLFGRIGADNDEALKKIDEAVDHAKKADRKLSNAFGEGLSKGLKTAGDNISDFVEEVGDDIGKLGDQVSQEVDDAVDNAQKGGDRLSAYLNQRLLADLKTAGNKVAGFVGGIGNKIDDVGSRILSLGTHFNSMASAASSSFTSIGKGAETVGNKLTNFITKPALAAGAALAGVTIGKGFQRLVSIDDAQARLKGLGHDAQSVQGIMDNALASVKGTAFGLDEAVTTASTAVAAGIKPGKELERYLTLVGDASAIAGTNMTEMGSIFNKVATSGVIQAEELNQLGDRGIPIYQMLADEMGVTAGEVKKLASEGKVSSETFLNAVEKGFGGAAAIMGATSFSAALDNFWASVSRIGANFLKGDGEANSFFETVKKGLADSLTLLEPLEELGGKAGLVFGESFGKMGRQFSDFVEKFKGWDQETQVAFLKQKASYAGLAVATGPALVGIGKLLQMGGKLGSAFSKNGKAISGFTKNLTGSEGMLGKFSKKLSSVGKEGSGLNKIMGGAGKSVTGFAKAIGGALTLMSGVGSLGFLMTAIAGIVAGFGLIPDGMRQALQDTLTTVRTKGPEILESLSNTIETRLPEIMQRGSALFTDLVSTITENMPALSQVGQTLLSGLLDGMNNDGQQVFDAVIGLITSIGQAFADNVGYIFSLGTLFIQQLGNAIAENSGEIVNLAITLIEALALGLIEALPQIGETAITIINGIKQGIEENKDGIREAATNIISALSQSFQENTEAWLAIGALIVGKIALGIGISAVTKLIPAAIKMVGKFVLGIVTAKGLLIAGAVALMVVFIAAIVKYWPEIKAKGREILNKLWEGLKSIWGSVSGWFESKMDKFKDWAGRVNLFSTGANIIKGLWSGLRSVWDSVASWFSSRMESLKDMAQSIMSIFSPSRFFRWLGEMMFKGLGVGMEREAPKADKIMADELEEMKRHAEQLAHLEAGSMNVPSISGANTDTAGYTFRQAELQAYQFELQEEMVVLLRKLLQKNTDLIINGRVISEEILDDINELNDIYNNRNVRIQGGGGSVIGRLV